MTNLLICGIFYKTLHMRRKFATMKMLRETPETKICKYCKTEVPYGARVCPQCRKKQGGKLKWIIVAVLVFGAIGAATGGGGGDDDKTGQASKENMEEGAKKEENIEKQNEEEENEDVEEEEKEEEKEKNELTVGSTFEKKGLKITVNDANLDFTDYSDEYGMYDPADGMKYIMASFTFENNGDSDAYVSIYDFDCYADNTSCEQAYLPDDSDFMNTNLSPGRNISFQTYYSVPVDSKSIELEYETSVWTGEKAVIKLQ